MTVHEPPSLESLSCTSCSARGSPHIVYQRSNVDKWGSLFFWIYVRSIGKHILTLTKCYSVIFVYLRLARSQEMLYALTPQVRRKTVRQREQDDKGRQGRTH